MQFLDGRLIVSPSDLTGLLECEHLTQQELAAARGELERPERKDPELEVLTRRGLEHEARHLASLRTRHHRVVELPFPEGTTAQLTQAYAETIAAMSDGVDVIYQGTFFDGRWRCHPDFLLRVDRPSKLGGYSYEVADAKLARKAKAAAVLQCCVYAEQLAAAQGVEPEHITLILGDGTEEELRLKDYAAYYRSVKRQFEQVVFPSAAGERQGGGTYPDPVDHCRICRWIDVCGARRRKDDHLCLVAGMRRDQKRPFEQVVDFLIDRLNRNPDLHVYHYAPYEPNALKWLASTYAIREAEVDRLLRGRVLVDLYRIVRQSVRIGTESYSLKELESLYRGKRSTEIVDAAGSIVAYEDWLESRDQRRLDEIAAYNEDDCISTAQLRDWLEARRLEAIAQYGVIPRPGPEQVEPSDTLRDIDARTAVLVDRLLEGVPEEAVDLSTEQQARYLLAHSFNR